jgi:hypothetical protein
MISQLMSARMDNANTRNSDSRSDRNSKRQRWYFGLGSLALVSLCLLLTWEMAREDILDVAWRIGTGTKYEHQFQRWCYANSKQPSLRRDLAAGIIVDGMTEDQVAAGWPPNRIEKIGIFTIYYYKHVKPLQIPRGDFLYFCDGRLFGAQSEQSATMFNHLGVLEKAEFMILMRAKQQSRIDSRKLCLSALAGSLAGCDAEVPINP